VDNDVAARPETIAARLLGVLKDFSHVFFFLDGIL